LYSEGLSETWIFNTQALQEWLGPKDALASLVPLMQDLGSGWGRRIEALVDEDAKGMSRILSALESFNSIMGIEGRTTYNTMERHEMEIIECPFASSPEGIGAQLEAFCQGLCRHFDDDFEVRFLSRMCGGDKTCHRIVRKKLSARGKAKTPT
jgi:hypothetical protein